MLPFVNENFEQESNLMPEPLYLCLSRPAFLVSFTEPNKQLFNVKSLSKFLNYGVSGKKYIDLLLFLGTEILLFIKQCPLKFMSGNK